MELWGHDDQLKGELLDTTAPAPYRDDILRRHLTEWCAKFKVFPEGNRFISVTGRAVYPAYVVTEADGTTWLSTLATFEESGIRGRIENNQTFQDMLLHAAASPDRCPDGLALIINDRPYQVIFQNTEEAGSDHIINVAFITKTDEPAKSPTILG